MNVILFDDATRNDLLPLVYTRPVADIRIGIVTIREKWEKRLNCQSSNLLEPMLRKKYALKLERENLLINGAVLPTNELVKEVSQLELNEKLVDGDITVAARIDEALLHQIIEKSIPVEKIDVVKKTSQFDNKKVRHLWDVFQLNDQEIKADFHLLTFGRKSQEVNKTNTVIGDQIFIEQGAKVSCSILNTETGPIYIGKNAEVMEGSIIRGALALCDHATLKLGTKIYGATTIGPHSKIGGEVNNSVVFGYSNKGHDGFMGNSVLGEWCNLGADTNTSNLKNNYGEVKVWNYPKKKLTSSEQQFVGAGYGRSFQKWNKHHVQHRNGGRSLFKCIWRKLSR